VEWIVDDALWGGVYIKIADARRTNPVQYITRDRINANLRSDRPRLSWDVFCHNNKQPKHKLQTHTGYIQALQPSFYS
jgi:hypothetical protein